MGTEQKKYLKPAEEAVETSSPSTSKKNVGTKTLNINGVEHTFNTFEEFRAKVMEIKASALTKGDKQLVVNNLSTKSTIKPSSTWDELNDGDKISITALGSGAV